MIRLLGHGLLLLFCLCVEFGFIHGLPVPWSLFPLCLPIAVYYAFQLRPMQALVWFIAIGFTADIHASLAVGETLVAAVLGAALIYVVQQHVSHSSLYAVMVTTGCTLLAWSAMTEGLRFIAGATQGVGLMQHGIAAGFGMLLAGILVLGIPWVTKHFWFSLRLPDAT